MSRNKQRNKELSWTSVKGRLSLFLDSRAPDTMRRAICERGIVPILLPPFESLPAPVCAHPDLLLYDLGEMLLVYRDYYEAHRELFEGFLVRTTDHTVKDKYPQDVGMDALRLGQNIFCLPKYTCPEILEGRNIVPVKQGYAACAALKVSESAIVTADAGIAQAAEEKGSAVLRISAGHIQLPGYDYGFIGGTAFLWQKALYFAGDLEMHPDGAAIADFCNKHGVKTISLVKGMPLWDLGFLKRNEQTCGL